MDHVEVLPTVVILISTAVFVVALFKKINLSPVLGYLTAGAFIGDYGLGIVTYDETHTLAEFGVVFLLFAIGLELSFERLKAIRHYVFGFGSLQVFLTALAIICIVIYLKQPPAAALIIGGGLALSSTAIVLQVIAENRAQATQVGRLSLAVLILQDFAVVPLLIIIPLLQQEASSLVYAIIESFIKAIIALIAIFIIGRVMLRPVFKLITSGTSAKTNELFIALILLIALAAAWITYYMGLSLALGAFVAGVLVAETEFQIQAEESIAPFKGLLLGLFFMSVGMLINIEEVYSDIGHIVLYTLILVGIKALIITSLGIVFGFSKGVSLHAGLLLSQGGEFAFILFNLGMQNNILTPHTAKMLQLVVTFSMAITPLLSILGMKLADKFTERKNQTEIIELGTKDLINHVVICGFGDVGKMVAKVLEAENLNYLILDINEENVSEESENGFPIFHGDVTQIETLNACGMERALSAILVMKNRITLKKTLKVISSNYPELPIIVRAADLKTSNELYENGATTIVPEDYEAGLQLGAAVLKSVGINDQEIGRIKAQFRAGNYIAMQNELEEDDGSI